MCPPGSGEAGAISRPWSFTQTANFRFPRPGIPRCLPATGAGWAPSFAMTSLRVCPAASPTPCVLVVLVTTAAFALAGAGLRAASAPIDSRPIWQDETRLHEGTVAPCATMTVYPDEASARTLRRDRSPFVQSLNGNWKFRWAPTPAGRTPGFWEPGHDDSAWPTIPVPSNVELQGYGIPIYSNIPYPWKANTPPVVDDTYNAVSSYRHRFRVPAAWAGRETYLTFDGVNSFFTVWLNGRRLGFSKDSRTPATFRLTPYLKPGDNLLAVEVFRWCDGSYLEDQDFWRLSGIFRDVTLWSTPAVHLRDLRVRTPLDSAYRDGLLHVEAEFTSTAPGPRAVALEVALLAPDGREVFRAPAGRTTVAPGSPARLAFQRAVTAPPLWSAEIPNLHTLLITSRDAATGEILECIPWRVGFRAVEVRQVQLEEQNENNVVLQKEEQQPERRREAQREETAPERNGTVYWIAGILLGLVIVWLIVRRKQDK